MLVKLCGARPTLTYRLPVSLLSGPARSPTVLEFRVGIFSLVLASACNYDAEVMLTSTGRASLNCTRGVLVLLLVFAASAFASGQNAPAESPNHFTFAPRPGPYPVGFRVVFQYDYSRTFQEAVDLLGKPNTGELARPVQTLIWYPAQKSDNPAIVFGDYLALGVKELEPTAAKGSIEALVRNMLSIGQQR
jgi:hypothetical protein